MGTIVVSYVDKPEGRAALRKAAEEARLHSSRLIVVEAGPGSYGQESSGLDEELSGLEHEIRSVDPDSEMADAVLDAAEEADASVIVIGLRRRSPVGKLMLGTNAQRILLDASCPVLTVKSEEAS